MFYIRCCKNVEDLLVGDYGIIAEFKSLSDAVAFTKGCPEMISEIIMNTTHSISNFWLENEPSEEFDHGGLHLELYQGNPDTEESLLVLHCWYPFDLESQSLITAGYGNPEIADDACLTVEEIRILTSAFNMSDSSPNKADASDFKNCRA